MGKEASSGASTGSGVSAMTKATTISPPSTVKVGNGGRHGGGSTIQSRGGTMKRAGSEPPMTPRKGFDGREPKLAGFIYSYGNDSADKFVKTTEEILQFAGTEFTHGNDMSYAYAEDIDGPRQFDRPLPIITDPKDVKYDMVEHEIWKEKVKAVAKKEARYEEECKQFYNLIWGQCTTTIQDKVRSLEVYKALTMTKSPVGLLKAIKSVMFNVESEVNRAHTFVMNDRRLYSLVREAHWTIPQYYKRFKTHIEVIKNTGGSIVVHPGLVDEELALMEDEDGDILGEKRVGEASASQRAVAEEAARDRYLNKLCWMRQ